MKKKHVWLLGELGFMGVGFAISMVSYRALCHLMSPWLSCAVAIIAYSLIVVFGIEWFHNGTTKEERFLQGDDPY